MEGMMKVLVTGATGVIGRRLEDIERFDSLDSSLSLRSVGDVQGQGRDAPIQVSQRLARTGIHPLRASPLRLSYTLLPNYLFP